MNHDEKNEICVGSDAGLRGEYPTGANLSNANLAGFNLSNADLRDANLTGANMTSADLRNANLAGATLPEILKNQIIPGKTVTYGEYWARIHE